jgi:hypothetical protein
LRGSHTLPPREPARSDDAYFRTAGRCGRQSAAEHAGGESVGGFACDAALRTWAWNYSNIVIAALGRIIEVVSGKPYNRFLNDRRFQPLEMKDMCFFVPPEKSGRVASYEPGGLKKVSMAQPKFPAPEGALFAQPATWRVSTRCYWAKEH